MTEQPPIEAIVRDSNRVSRAEVQVLIGELRAGGDAAWNAPTMCSDWTAKDVIAHLVQALRFFSAASHAALDGQPPPPSDPAQLHAAAAQLAAQPEETLLGLLAEHNEGFCEYLDSLDVAALPTPVDLSFLALPVWQLALLRMNEIVLHHWDIRAAKQPDLPVESDGVPLALDFTLAGAQIMATHGEKTDGVWQLDVGGPGGGPIAVRVQGDQVTAQRGEAPAADVQVALESEALLRLLWGRLDLAAAMDSGRVRLDGDRERALALQRLFPGG